MPVKRQPGSMAVTLSSVLDKKLRIRLSFHWIRVYQAWKV
jgi:hypothetical protein